jgi:hypothetical protein
MKRALAVLAMVLLASTAHARGYVARACGLDTNRNGQFGEAADCAICNPKVDPPAGWTRWLVDCDGGSNTASCGTSTTSECKSVDYVITGRGNFSDDTPDVICWTGICAGSDLPVGGITIPSGVAGTYTVPKIGHETHDPVLPMKPTLILAQDKDGDGDYPPHDRDDTAVMDGCSARQQIVYALAASGTSYFEIAHGTYKNTGSRACIGPNGQTGFNPTLGFLQANGGPVHGFIHDLEGIDIERGQALCDTTALFRLFTSHGQIWHDLTIRNVRFGNFAGFLARGGVGTGKGERGPLDINGSTFTWRGCSPRECAKAPACNHGDVRSNSSAGGIKLWGLVGDGPNNGIVLSDSILDSQAALNGFTSSSSSFAVDANDCAHNVVAAGNELIDFKRPFSRSRTMTRARCGRSRISSRRTTWFDKRRTRRMRAPVCVQS